MQLLTDWNFKCRDSSLSIFWFVALNSLLKIFFTNPNGENEWEKHFLEPRRLKIEAVTVATVQAVYVSWPSFNAALCGGVQVLYMWPFHQHLLPSILFYALFLGVSLRFSHLAVAESVKSVVLSEVCPRLAHSQSFSDLFRHIQFTQAQCAVKAMILIQGKNEKNRALFPPANFNVYISFESSCLFLKWNPSIHPSIPKQIGNYVAVTWNGPAVSRHMKEGLGHDHSERSLREKETTWMWRGRAESRGHEK